MPRGVALGACVLFRDPTIGVVGHRVSMRFSDVTRQVEVLYVGVLLRNAVADVVVLYATVLLRHHALYGAIHNTAVCFVHIATGGVGVWARLLFRNLMASRVGLHPSVRFRNDAAGRVLTVAVTRFGTCAADLVFAFAIVGFAADFGAFDFAGFGLGAPDSLAALAWWALHGDFFALARAVDTAATIRIPLPLAWGLHHFCDLATGNLVLLSFPVAGFDLDLLGVFDRFADRVRHAFGAGFVICLSCRVGHLASVGLVHWARLIAGDLTLMLLVDSAISSVVSHALVCFIDRTGRGVVDDATALFAHRVIRRVIDRPGARFGYRAIRRVVDDATLWFADCAAGVVGDVSRLRNALGAVRGVRHFPFLMYGISAIMGDGALFLNGFADRSIACLADVFIRRARHGFHYRMAFHFT